MRFFLKDGVVYDMTTRDTIAGLDPAFVRDALNEKWMREDAATETFEIPAGTYTLDQLRSIVGSKLSPQQIDLITNLPVPGGSGNQITDPDPDG